MCATFLALCLILAEPTDYPIRELEARHWFNNPVFVLNDQRDVLLVFFSTQDDSMNRMIRTLNRLSRRPDLLVIGITSDSRTQVEKWIARERVRFTVGAESGMAAKLKLDKLPKALRLKRNESDQFQEFDPASTESLVPAYGEYGAEDTSKLTEPRQLEDMISSNAYGRKRFEAVQKLYHLSDPDAFIAFAESQIDTETDPWVRNALVYYKEIRQGVRQPDEPLSPATRYYREFSSNAQADGWREAREFMASLPTTPIDQLPAVYVSHLRDEPNAAVVRRATIDHLERNAPPELARAILLNLLAVETDYQLRLRIVGAFTTVCKVGDTEIADSLEALAKQEQNLLHVRPMMEYVANYLRTGEEDTRRMQPRPR